MAQGRFRPREADIGRALVQGLADLFGAHALMQGGPGLFPDPLRRLDGSQNDQRDEAALTRIQAALSGDLAMFQTLPDGPQFGIRPGQCRRTRLSQFLPVCLCFPHPVHGSPHDISNGCAGCPGMGMARCRHPGEQCPPNGHDGLLPVGAARQGLPFRQIPAGKGSLVLCLPGYAATADGYRPVPGK